MKIKTGLAIPMMAVNEQSVKIRNAPRTRTTKPETTTAAGQTPGPTYPDKSVSWKSCEAVNQSLLLRRVFSAGFKSNPAGGV